MNCTPLYVIASTTRLHTRNLRVRSWDLIPRASFQYKFNRCRAPKRAEGNFGIFSHLESNTKILYNIEKSEQFAGFSVYTNNEAAFQAQKTKNRRLRFQLFSKANPSEAKSAGRRIDLRSDWEEVKNQIMYEIVQAKFNQNPDLKEKLLATGDEHLEEGNTWGDTTWGTVNGIGENRLGKILMRVRDELQEESK